MTEVTKEKSIFSIKRIAENIDTLILSKHKKAEIAKKMEIKPQSLHVILKRLHEGKNVGIETIKKIAIAGGITCEELLAQEEPKEEILKEN